MNKDLTVELGLAEGEVAEGLSRQGVREETKQEIFDVLRVKKSEENG